MLPLDTVVKVVSLTDMFYPVRTYRRLGIILLCDYRGNVTYPEENYSQVAFTYPRWFDEENWFSDGLTYLWVKNCDIQVVAYPN